MHFHFVYGGMVSHRTAFIAVFLLLFELLALSNFGLQKEAAVARRFPSPIYALSVSTQAAILESVWSASFVSSAKAAKICYN